MICSCAGYLRVTDRKWFTEGLAEVKIDGAGAAMLIFSLPCVR
jgi:hypothetical protein